MMMHITVSPETLARLEAAAAYKRVSVEELALHMIMEGLEFIEMDRTLAEMDEEERRKIDDDIPF